MNTKQLLKKKIKYSLVFLFFLNFLLSSATYAQSTIVEGKITDAAGLSLPGVNIQEKGTKNGTSTDFEGSFKINVTRQKNSNYRLTETLVHISHSHVCSLSLLHAHTHTHTQRQTQRHTDTHTLACPLCFPWLSLFYGGVV